MDSSMLMQRTAMMEMQPPSTSSAFGDSIVNADHYDDDDDDDAAKHQVTRAVALEYFSLGETYRHQDQYEQALKWYNEALELFQRSSDLRNMCFAANCLYHMGTVHLRQRNFDPAMYCWKQAHRRYQTVLQRIRSGTSRSMNGHDDDPPFCLDVMIVETLQSQAAAHLKLEDPDRVHAIECHQEVVDFLMDLSKAHPFDENSPRAVENLVFQPISRDKHTELLMTSLESLGRLYRVAGNEEKWIRGCEEALELLRNRKQDGPKDTVSLAIARILRNLADVYIKIGDQKKAVDALSEAVDTFLSKDELPPSDCLEALDNLAAKYEETHDFEQALICYEHSLLARNRFFGQNSVTVGKSLINVARVMELQGNVEGSLDLYRVAHSIYTKQLITEPLKVDAEDIHNLLGLFPSAMEQGRYQESVAYISKCIEVADDPVAENHIELDKTYLFYSLGQAYIGLHDYVSATVCLVEAAKHDGAIKEEQVFALLQRVEFLQREEQKSEHRDIDDIRHISSGSQRQLDALGFGNTFMGDRLESPIRFLLFSKDGQRSCESEDDLDANKIEDEDVTACYDSESMSASNPVVRSDLSSSLFESDILSETLDVPRIDIDVLPSESEALDGADIDIPENDSFPDDDIITLSRIVTPDSRSSPPKYSSLARVSTDPTRGLNEITVVGPEEKSIPCRGRLRVFLGSPRKFIRRQGSSRSFSANENDGDHEKCHGIHDENDPLIIPSEEDYHLAIDGPVQYIAFRAKSWDSGVSQITMRLEDPNSSADSKQDHEWWWGVTTEGFSRFFPTSYLNKAVEAAEGFLSAKSIHSQRKSSPLEIVSDEESANDDESVDDDNEDGDHPSILGVAESKTQLGFKSMRTSLAVPPYSTNRDRKDSALGVYSSRQQRSTQGLESEISRFIGLATHQQERLGKDHPDLAHTMFTLAVLQSHNRATAPAIECAVEALRIQKSNGLLEDAARSLHFLADLYMHQKQYGKSLIFYKEALRFEVQEYGDFRDEIARTLNCIGTAHSLQNEFALAMESHQEALRILKECHGDDLKYPLVSETLCQIGAVYYRERNSLTKSKIHNSDAYSTFIEAGMLEIIGRAHEDRGSYKMAIAFFEERLQFLETRGSASSLSDLDEVATTLNSLGMLNHRAGFYVEAIEYYERAIKFQRKLGCDRVQLATARVLSGSVHFHLGDWNVALELLEDALDVLHDELGTEHQTYAAALFHLGVIQAGFFNLDTANHVFAEALKIQTRLLGVEHPATLRTRREIGNLYCNHLSKIDDALDLFEDILAAQRQIHGDRHPNIAETLFCIGRAYARKGDYTSALQILEECYYMRTEFLGWDHPHQASTLHEIGVIQLKRNRVNKAMNICESVLNIREESLSEHSIDIAVAYAAKGSCLVAQGKLEASTSKLLTDALDRAESVVGSSHPAIAEIHIQLSNMYLRKCQFDQARKSIEKALDIFRSSGVSDDYPGVKEAQENLERVEHDEMLYV